METNNLKELTDKIYATVVDAIEEYEELDGLMLKIEPKIMQLEIVEDDNDSENFDYYPFMELVMFNEEGKISPDRDTITQIAGEYI